MEQTAPILEAVAALLWPLTIFTIVGMFRQQILKLADTMRRQIERGAVLKWNDVELRGIAISEVSPRALDNSVYSHIPATKKDLERRQEIYAQSRSLMLVHTAKRTEEVDEDGLTYFDLSIFLIPHQVFDEENDYAILKFGRPNEVKEVEYYLGKSWYVGEGRGEDETGEWFKTNNGADGFAVLFKQVVGPALCLARVTFHDGKTVELSRYLDLEGAGGIRGKIRAF